MSLRMNARFHAAALEQHHIENAVQQTLHGLNSSGGSSVNLKGKSVPTHGYMVGGIAQEKNIGGGPKRIGEHHVRSYINENAHHLGRPDHYLGSWHDKKDNSVALDVSRHFKDRNEAHAYARLHNEKAVYNLHEGKDENTDWAQTVPHQSSAGKSVDELTEQAVHNIKHNGGTTMDHRGNEVSHGYTVGAGPHHEFEGEVTHEHVRPFIEEHHEKLKDGDHVLGGWHNHSSGKTELDLNHHVEGEHEARQLGEKKKRSVYDVKAMDCVPKQKYPCAVCKDNPDLN